MARCLARRVKDGSPCVSPEGHTRDHTWQEDVNALLSEESDLQRLQQAEAPAPMWTTVWPEFGRLLQDKLEQGHRTYGDRSFDLPMDQLLVELEAELIDVCGWSVMLWRRLRHIREVLGTIKP